MGLIDVPNAKPLHREMPIKHTPYQPEPNHHQQEPFMSDTKPFVLYRNTKDRCGNEHEAEAIEKADELATIIEYDEFAENCEHGEIAEQLGYGENLPLSEDWHVSFTKSTYGGLPCFIFGHSECDFIFLKPEDAKMLQEQFSKGISPSDWERATGYGKSGTDPR
jgi:hypothetical protein